MPTSVFLISGKPQDVQAGRLLPVETSMQNADSRQSYEFMPDLTANQPSAHQLVSDSDGAECEALVSDIDAWRQHMRSETTAVRSACPSS